MIKGKVGLALGREGGAVRWIWRWRRGVCCNKQNNNFIHSTFLLESSISWLDLKGSYLSKT
jgi:hypothetical protein